MAASLFLFLIIRYSAKAVETFAEPRVQKLLQQSAKVGGGLHINEIMFAKVSVFVIVMLLLHTNNIYKRIIKVTQVKKQRKMRLAFQILMGQAIQK